MSGVVSDFEAQLEQIIDDWVGSGGQIREVMDALAAKLVALEDEHGSEAGEEFPGEAEGGEQ